ncbi:MAG: beta-lactamase family protein [Holophagales bacterium]|jgi:CubicO group peptidase (beta-lactamase class C family)|nr:beta-lactamase family protein [Holophagales bacterium]
MMFLVAVLLGLALPATAASMPEVDRFVEERMKGHLVPGLALVVIKDGEVVHRRGFGELDESRPVIIGSLSKAITATAVLQLVDGGKVELDAPMQRYLGETRFADPAAAAITVRQLLNQSSGLPTEAARGAGRDATLAEHVDALREVRLVAVPGERHIYSSPNYQILGRIVELVSGQPFGRFVETRIFSPLGMTASGVDAAAVPRLAPGHNLWWGFSGPSPYRFERGRLPTASIITTADDLSRFALSHLGVGPQLLTPESLALAHRGAAQAEGFSYAMGWREGTTGGVPSLWHGGALPSYRGAVVLLPKSRSAVLVLTNSSSLFADHTREIAAGIVTLIEGRPLPPGFRPLRTTYAILAVLCVGAVALQLRSLLRAARREGKAPKRSAVVFFDFVLPIAVVLLLPRLTKVSYRAMWEGAPDVVTTAAVLLLLGLCTGLLRLRRTG